MKVGGVHLSARCTSGMMRKKGGNGCKESPVRWDPGLSGLFQRSLTQAVTQKVLTYTRVVWLLWFLGIYSCCNEGENDSTFSISQW